MLHKENKVVTVSLCLSLSNYLLLYWGVLGGSSLCPLLSDAVQLRFFFTALSHSTHIKAGELNIYFLGFKSRALKRGGKTAPPPTHTLTYTHMQYYH